MSSNEDKLRRVLSEHAAQVEPSASAWPQIRAGAARRRRWRQVMQYGGAAAGVTAAIVAGALYVGSTANRVTPDDAVTTETPSPDASETRSPIASQAPSPTGIASSQVPTSEPPTGSATAQLPATRLGRLGDQFASVLVDKTGMHVVLISKRDGSINKKLTSEVGKAATHGPVASPDGKYVYYVRADAGCESGVYRVPTAGGDSEGVIGPKESVIAYALNGDGTRIATLQYAGCGAGEPRTLLVEYDAASGRQLRVLPVDAVPQTVLTGVAWRPGREELALIRSGQDGTPDRVDLVDVQGTRAVLEGTPLTFPSCFSGGLKYLAFSEDSLYAGVDCLDRKGASMQAQIFRAHLDTDSGPEKIASATEGETVAGLSTEPAPSGAIVYSTAHSGGEELAGPTTVHRLDIDGRTSQVFERPAAALLFGLAW